MYSISTIGLVVHIEQFPPKRIQKPVASDDKNRARSRHSLPRVAYTLKTLEALAISR